MHYTTGLLTLKMQEGGEWMVSGMQSTLLFTALVNPEAGDLNSWCEIVCLRVFVKDQAWSLIGDVDNL
jgi:hypothetical protein